MQLFDPLAKKSLIVLLYKACEGFKPEKIFPMVKDFQNTLENNFGFTFGYSFNDPPPLGYEVYDATLQKDLERYEACGLLIELSKSKVTYMGEFYLEVFLPYIHRFEKLFGEDATNKLTKYLEEIKRKHTEITFD